MELPELEGRAQLVRRYAHLLSHFSREIGKRPLVLQNAKFFPDLFERDEASAVRLVRRLQAHAGMDDIPVHARVVAFEPPQESEARAGSCGSGGCGPVQVTETPKTTRLIETGEGWQLNVFDVELHHPVGLTTQMARALGRIFLEEARTSADAIEAPIEVSTELAAVALGFGPLLLDGSYIYGKSCGGPSVSRLTTLSVGELAIVSSLFIAMGRHSTRQALGYLGTTQRALLSEASDWAASNAKIVEELGEAPGQLATGTPKLAETRPWLLRLFDRPRRPTSPSLESALSGSLGDAELLELARSLAETHPTGEAGRPSTQPRAPKGDRHDELRALVDEALRSS